MLNNEPTIPNHQHKIFCLMSNTKNAKPKRTEITSIAK